MEIRLVHELKVAQRSMKCAMFRISLAGKSCNVVIRKKTKVTYIVSRRTDSNWSRQVLEWRPRLGSERRTSCIYYLIYYGYDICDFENSKLPVPLINFIEYVTRIIQYLTK